MLLPGVPVCFFLCPTRLVKTNQIKLGGGWLDKENVVLSVGE